MELVFVFGIIFLLFVKVSKMDRLSKNILLIYLTIWFISLIIASSGTYGLKPCSYNTIILLIGHIVAFTIGYCCIKLSRKFDVRTELKHFNLGIDKIISSKWFIAILFISLLYIITIFSKYLNVLLAVSSLGTIREDFYSGELLGQGFSIINNFFLIPWILIILAIFGYLSFYKRNFIWLICLIELLLYSVLSGGRNEFVNIIVSLLFFGICVGMMSKMRSKKNYLIFILLIAATYFGIIITTSARSGFYGIIDNLEDGIEETNMHIVTYLGGPTVAFDYAVTHDVVSDVDGYQYGAMTFASIDELVFNIEAVIRKVTNNPPRERAIINLGNYFHENYIDIGTEWKWNALYTSCLYYYLDFGSLGVFILPFLFGMLIRFVIKKIYRYQSFWLLILLSIIFCFLLNSFQRFFMIRMSQLILMIILYYLGTRRISFQSLNNK